VRLFVALEIPEDVRAAIAIFMRESKALDTSWKWTRPENLHVTLKFLGEIPHETLDAVRGALRGVPAEWPMPMQFRGVGFFPNAGRPRVLWARIEAPESLAALAARISEALAGVGVPREERAFTPHLTLARNEGGKLSPQLREALQKNSTKRFGAANAPGFHLFESKLKSTGAEYTTLESFPGARER
jgi:2'-5' RNA ligase